MVGKNLVILVGNLVRDPEMKYTEGGTAIANFSIATSEEWKDKNTGEKKEKTEWHRIVAWRRLAEICGEYLKKGSQVYIEGKLQTRSWGGEDGIKKYTTEIVANQMQMMGGRSEPAEAGYHPPEREKPKPPEQSSLADNIMDKIADQVEGDEPPF